MFIQLSPAEEHHNSLSHAASQFHMPLGPLTTAFTALARRNCVHRTPKLTEFRREFNKAIGFPYMVVCG